MLRLVKIILVLIITAADMHAQQGVSPSGGDGTSAGGSINYTIGQVDYLNASTSTGSLNQGVQHPVIKILTDSINDVTLTPNLTSDFMILNTGKTKLSNASYMIYEVRGRLIKKEIITDMLTSISINFLADAAYLIEVDNADSSLKTFKIIKN